MNTSVCDNQPNAHKITRETDELLAIRQNLPLSQMDMGRINIIDWLHFSFKNETVLFTRVNSMSGFSAIDHTWVIPGFHLKNV